jgi:hypothetical protein
MIDRREHPPVVQGLTGHTIIQSHIEQLRHTLLVMGPGMSVVQVAQIQREIAYLERMKETANLVSHP